jgi:hypothetical protein
VDLDPHPLLTPIAEFYHTLRPKLRVLQSKTRNLFIGNRVIGLPPDSNLESLLIGLQHSRVQIEPFQKFLKREPIVFLIVIFSELNIDVLFDSIIQSCAPKPITCIA